MPPHRREPAASWSATPAIGSRLKEQLLGVEGVPTWHPRGSKIARGALYHYEPNPSREYCLPTCGEHRAASARSDSLFAHREQATAWGLAPCVDCRPDLHPLSR